MIVSDEGFGKNDYIETQRKLVVVTGPGPCSGKMATCLSQLYHEHKRGVQAGYAKFETFPIWNIPLKHPVNVAYEAATADLNDVNMIDPFHLEAYGKTAINYNRDIEIFPVVNAMMERIMGQSPYKSPTDMGVNMVGCAICNDEVVREAANQEIIRRYYAALCTLRQGMGEQNEVSKIELLMNQLNITAADRPVAAAAVAKAEASGSPATAIQLNDGRIITGKTSSLLGASSSMLLNVLKVLGGIPDEVQLLSPTIIEPIQRMKTGVLGNHNPRLHTDEVLIASDTTVAAGGEILGKPRDESDARRMLRMLSGSTHEVATGIAIAHKGQIYTDCSLTHVHVDEIPDGQIDSYIASGECNDKAGAYGIQGSFSRWISGIDGCYFGVVGLPVNLLSKLFYNAVGCYPDEL